MIPSGWKRIQDDSVKNILMVGCGGGFDFVHSLLLYRDLIDLGKNVIMGSYSFGQPSSFSGPSATHVDYSSVINTTEQLPHVVRVDASCSGSPDYCPELGFCKCLDENFPDRDPHYIYAYYARSFTVSTLNLFYAYLVKMHSIDAIIAVDGGSDSLMKGNEHGLGDPIEDAVSVAAIAKLCRPVLSSMHLPSLVSIDGKQPFGILIAVGFGSDRFNDVSDSSSLRAVAELTRDGGFLGSVSIEKSGGGFQLYREGLATIYRLQTMRSILSGAIVAAGLGCYGDDCYQDFQRFGVDIGGRVPSSNGTLFVWPLMAMLWMFDIKVVHERSLICKIIDSCETPREAERSLFSARRYQNQKNKGDYSSDTKIIVCKPEHLPCCGQKINPTNSDTISSNPDDHSNRAASMPLSDCNKNPKHTECVIS